MIYESENKRSWLNRGIFLELPRGAEENQENPQSRQTVLLPRFEPTISKYKSRLLRLDLPVRPQGIKPVLAILKDIRTLFLSGTKYGYYAVKQRHYNKHNKCHHLPIKVLMLSQSHQNSSHHVASIIKGGVFLLTAHQSQLGLGEHIMHARTV